MSVDIVGCSFYTLADRRKWGVVVLAFPAVPCTSWLARKPEAPYGLDAKPEVIRCPPAVLKRLDVKILGRRELTAPGLDGLPVTTRADSVETSRQQVVYA
jgi:hypothetical protein